MTTGRSLFLKKLNDRHRLFCRLFVDTLRKAQSAEDAGYSARSRGTMASKLLAEPLIQEEIERQRERLTNELGVGPPHILREWARVAISSLADFQDPNDPHRFTLKNATPDQLACVKEVTTREHVVGEDRVVVETSIKLHDKVKSLDSLGRHFGMFEKDNRQGTPADPEVIRVTSKAPRIPDEELPLAHDDTGEIGEIHQNGPVNGTMGANGQAS